MTVPDLQLLAPVERPDAATLLGEVESCVRRFCVLPSEHAYVAVTLWIATTHVLAAFEHAPRLVARSAEKRSGKSRLVEVVAGMVHTPLRTVNASTAYLFRSLDQGNPPTILIDEADALFGTKTNAEKHEDLRGLLNAGHQRGLTYGRCVGPSQVPTEFPTFAMAMVAGIGRMPDTIEDRAVVIAMRRRKETEEVNAFRSRRDGPVLDELRDRLHDWGAQSVQVLAGAEPVMPDGVDDRAADTWEPLLAVADHVGGRWPERGREAAKHFVLEATEDDQAQSVGVQLLADVKSIFDDTCRTFIGSTLLVDSLEGMEDAPWADLGLNPSKLGRRLSPYGIRTGHSADKSKRGYRREDFTDAWDRYLPQKASQDVPESPPGS